MKKSICGILTFVLFLLSAIGLINMLPNKLGVYAYTTDNSKNITIENANFNSNTKNEFPFAPSGYTLADPSFNNVNADNVNAEAGVISVKDTDIAQNPLADDTFVLQISSKNSTHVGYLTNSTINMGADSYFAISTDIYTSNADGIANLYLIDDKEIVASIQNISSMNNWTTYTFFIKTSTSARNLKLGMYLNGNGAVYFDNLCALELNSKEYTKRLNNLSASTRNETDLTLDSKLDTRVVVSNTFYQTDFESGKSGPEYSYSNMVDASTNNEASDRTIDTAFKIENKQKTYAEYSTNANFFNFTKNNVYKVTVTAKALNISGKATISLKETDEKGNNVTDAKNNLSTSITTNTNSSITNNYQKYSFYINSSPLQDKTYRLVVSLGDSENKTTGELYISSVTIANATYAEFESASDSNKTNLATNNIASSSDFMLDNGNFNGLKISNVSNPYPATPINWDVVTGKNQQYYGIVNTSQFDELDKSLFINPRTPGIQSNSVLNNNILMMYNSTADTLSYTSKTKTLEKKTYHKFSLNVQTQNSPAKISLFSKRDNKDNIIKSITIDTEYTWQTVQFFIYTGYQKCDIGIKVELNSANYGYVYLDDAYFDYQLISTDRTDATDYNNAVVSDKTVKVDLSNILVSNSNTDFAKTEMFSGENVTIGTINLNSPTLNSNVLNNSANIDTFRSIGGDNVLGVRAIETGHYIVNSNVGYTLTADNYYKLVLSLYVQNLECEDDLASALTLSLSGFDKKFTGVLSKEDDKPGNITEDGWREYTFYLNPDTDCTSYLSLELGSSTNAVKGDIFIGGIEFVDEGITNFDGIKDSDYTLVLKNTTVDKDEDSDDKEQDDEASNNKAWIFAIPTILFALAIVIAIVGVLVRKVKWRKPKKKSKNEYDRNRTVSKQVYMRKATTEREAKLRELNQELTTLSAERVKYEETYKQDLNKLRDMKIKRADSKEIAKLEKEMKKNQKLSANIGLSINRIEGDIEYVKTDAYLNSLIKKLENERYNAPGTSNNEADK